MKKLFLLVITDTAEKTADLEAAVLAQELGLLFDLYGEFPCRYDDERLLVPVAVAGEEQVEDGDEEGRRFPGPRLGLDVYINALEGLIEGLFLDRCAVGERGFVDPAQYVGVKIEFCEFHQIPL